MRVLVLNAGVRIQIAEALRRAREETITLAEIKAMVADIPQNKEMKLKNRPKGWKRIREPVEVLIGDGFRCCISFEEQPFGLCKHLSVSIESKVPNATPAKEAFEMIMHEFGITWGEVIRGWNEEYEENKIAVNILAKVETLQ